MATVLTRLVARVVSGMLKVAPRADNAARRLQVNMDELTVATCLDHRERTNSNANDLSQPREFEIGSQATTDYCFERTRVQLHYMFECVERGENDDRLSEGGIDFKMPFQLSVRKSGMRDSGEGLFLKGKAIKGSVIALYPGLVAVPEHGADVYEYMLGDGKNDNEESNPYAVARIDDVLIDGSLDLQSIDDEDEATWPQIYLPDDSANKKMLASRRNPYALAHKINHANSMDGVNLLQVPFDFDASFPKHLRAHIPTKLASREFLTLDLKPEPLARSIVYIATRDIQDEELLVDYRMNPESGYPEWYTPIDEESAARRWSFHDYVA